MTGTLQDFPDASSDREHLQRLLSRLWAAEHALAEEIAGSLAVSEECALVLARMRIDELIESGRRADDELAEKRGDEFYCEQCWALLSPASSTPAVAAGEVFATCVYCGQPAYSEHEWQDAA